MAAKFITEAYVENNYLQKGKNQSTIGRSNINAIPWSNWFEIWLESLADTLPQADSYELSLRLTCDREMMKLNNQYRNKNQPTDVLAFAALESIVTLPREITQSLYLGDIVISLDTAYQQAQEQGHSLITEVAWLATHGLLHLLGWDHPDDNSLEEMLQKQGNLLKLVENTNKVSV